MRWVREAALSPATTTPIWWKPPSPSGSSSTRSLLAESPKHAGLLLAACSGFTEYAYAFVDARVDEEKDESLERADALRVGARKLYLRANRYGMRGLEARYPGFGVALDNDAATALKRTDKLDVALLYWTAANLQPPVARLGSISSTTGADAKPAAHPPAAPPTE